MITGTVAACTKPDHRHSRRDRGLDTGRAVLDHDAVCRQHPELPGREEEEVGSGFAMRHLRGAENMRIEQRQQPGDRERLPDAVEMAVRCDATRRRQRREQLLDPGDRRQLALESLIDTGAHPLEEPLRQRAAKSSLDRGGQRDAVLAEPEHHRLVHRDRKLGGDQALAENAAEYDLAVDQHPIAVEDDESRHERSGPAVFSTSIWPRYMAPDASIRHGYRNNADNSAPRFALK